jgi:hypothetical protein
MVGVAMPRVLNSNDPFTRRAEEFADRYGGANDDARARRARFHLAIHLLLAEYDLSDDDISEQVLRDGSEQGIDFFWVSDDEVPRVFVVQVKDWAKAPKAKQKDAVNKMVDEVQELRSKKRVSGDWPTRRKDRFYELKRLEGRDFVLEYVLALTGVAGPEVALDDFADGRFGSDSRLRVMGRDALLLTESARSRALEKRTTIKFRKEQMLAVITPSTTVVGLVAVGDYVAATEHLGTLLFETNPRLFLSNKAGPNKAMRLTLDSPDERKSFHVLNNGITAVCKELTLTKSAASDGPYTVNIKGMQVVNGCQTTETLWAWARDEPQAAATTMVLLRLVATSDEAFSALISRTTNTQSAILGTDLVANSIEHRRIKKELESLIDRPIFYENRRGAIKKLLAVDKQRFVVGISDWGNPNVTQYRIIKMRELAQALQAVTGLPEQAKEGIAGIFKPNNDRYNFLFKTIWSGEQMGLVADLYKFVANTPNWGDSAWFEEDASGRESLNREYLKLATLGRFYLMHLVYEYLRNSGNPFGEVGGNEDDPNELRLMSSERSREIREDLRTSLGPSLLLAVDSLREVKETEHGSDGDRALLRQAKHKDAIRKCFRSAVLKHNLVGKQN